MKILVYGINYYPELTGIGKYTGEMCEWLASRGHQVEMITSMPYYPEWKIHTAYRNRFWYSENIKGVKVHRTPFYVPEKVTGFTRILHELSFVISSSVYWLPRFFRTYDVVIAICPPLQAGIFPYMYQTLRKKPFVFHVQDLQVDVARELGMIKSKMLFTFLDRVEKFLMRRASIVSTIGTGMKKRVLQKGVKKENVILLPNWVDTDFIKPLTHPIPLKTELGFAATDKIVLYSGSMGDKQGLEMIIGIAEKLQSVPSLYFLFCGAGASKEKLRALAVNKKLANVRFLDVQPYEKLDQLLSMADIHLVLQKKAASDLVFPSKLLSILSAGGLSIVTASPGSELYDFIVKNNLGIVIEPEDQDRLEQAILENIFKDQNEIKTNARNFAEKELTITKVLNKFETTLIDFYRLGKL